MTCWHPLRGYRGRSINSATGKRPVVFTRSSGFADQALDVPCGRCTGCRLERSRQWAVRCWHESTLYESNCFLTLTFAPEHLPAQGVSVRDVQLFMKRLRKRFDSSRIRFFACGEYGSLFSRPHYHLCLFNFDFTDKVLLFDSRDYRLYTSSTLAELWPFGLSSIGDVTFESAGYVARYILKKVVGKDAPSHYGECVDPDGVVVPPHTPEFIVMSRRPGIGRPFYDLFKSDMYPRGTVVVRGRECQTPKAYDSYFELEEPEAFQRLKRERSFKTEAQRLNSDSFRLPVREAVMEARLHMLPRPFDEA